MGRKRNNSGSQPPRAKSAAPPARAGGKKPIEQYEHTGKTRAHIPPVGLVTPDTDPPAPAARRTYAYDPHLDPQLVWAGKAERASFDIPTVSLHVHERIDPRTILEAVRANHEPRPSGSGPLPHGRGSFEQMSLFGRPEENRPLREEFPFYDHRRPLGWKNRLIAGDSLLVMNSLLEKEGLGGQVQMAYLDPPYGIRYGSNFQPFVNKRDVKDGADDDLTLEPETLKAFRDTWELGIHSYLTYLRDRLLLARELLHESGSCFVQISDENLHHVREVMDEVFGADNFLAIINFAKTTSASTTTLPSVFDYLVWYAKDHTRLKYRKLYRNMDISEAMSGEFKFVELPDGKVRTASPEEKRNPKLLPAGARVFRTNTVVSPEPSPKLTVEIDFGGTRHHPGSGRHWKTNVEGMQRLFRMGRLLVANSPTRMFKRYFDDFPVIELNNTWSDTRSEQSQVYVVQTVEKVIERCLLMTTDPGDLVFDPTCGSGTTAYVAEQWGRRWITTDTSRVAVTLARQRLMTAVFDYYRLAHPEQGVGSGFVYRTVPHVTLKSIANNPEIKEGMAREQIDRAIAKYADTETLYDQPEVDRGRARVAGPFTVEAVPAAAFGQPEVRPIDAETSRDREGAVSPTGEPPLPDGRGSLADALTPDPSLARSGETLRQSEWRAELLKTGIRAKGGAKIEFVRVEPLPGTRWLSADAETREDPSTGSGQAKPRRAVVSFGPEHAPLEQRQVGMALEEAQKLIPKPALVIFAALQFDPEAAKDIDEINWPGVTLLKAQMNGDLVTEDLKKRRSSNESFWLIGQPDIEVRKHKGTSRDRQGADLYEVEVHGFDYYNPKSGKVESGSPGNIALWMLDPDYDGRSVYPRQVFFPMAGPKDGWARLAKNLKAEIDEELIEQYRGTVSLPFEKGKHGRVAVKIVDDRGIESLRIVEVP